MFNYESEQEPKAFSDKLALRLKNFISAHLSTSSFMSFNIPLLLTGARGAGKASLIRRVAAELGVHVVEVSCLDFPMAVTRSDLSSLPNRWTAMRFSTRLLPPQRGRYWLVWKRHKAVRHVYCYCDTLKLWAGKRRHRNAARVGSLPFLRRYT
jgi:hypothetical protein